MSKRVFQLAKELGVKSTAVVAKCHAEGLESKIKNHMSTLSAGLEATIREWFSSGDNATTVETTAPVDLEKVKAKKPRKKRKTKAQIESEKEKESAVAVLEAPDETENVTEVATEAETTTVAEVAVEAEAETQSETPAETEAAEVQKTTAHKKTEKTTASAKPKHKSPKQLEADKQVEPDEEADQPPQEAEKVAEDPAKPSEKTAKAKTITLPEKVKPKAPVPFVPAPAVLKGPKVIREGTVEIIPAAPPRRGPRRNTAAPAASAGSVRDSGGQTGSRHRRKRYHSETEGGEKGSAKTSKTRTQRRSGGRRHESSTDLASSHERGNRDLLERQQRLAQASGSKLHRRERRLAQEERTAGSTGIMEPQRIEKAAIKEPITVKDLSAAIGVRINEIMAKLMEMGVMAALNQSLDADAAVTVALDFGVELIVEEKVLLWDKLQKEFDTQITDEQQSPRPPIVAFLGHVDHGKTSLLDKIRKASVTDGEAGGITQHIGSYLHDDGKHRISFLDTPGHKAFTQMRARGANITDVLVLVVAADDGVMPQTEEAINHAKAADAPVIVALNKMDLPNTDENRVLGQLSEKGLVPAEWGGDTEVVRTSATTGTGIEDLLEHLEYIAELNHLTARAEGPATGWVVESEITPTHGVVAKLLVKSGALKPQDIVVSGCSYGRIKTIKSTSRQTLTNAGPSMPVEITGLSEVPVAGDRFFVVDGISRAAEIASEQQDRRREKALAQRRRVTLENLFTEIAAGEVRELNVIVKADVQGSVDVLRNTIMEMNTSEVAVRILHAAVGGISESDVVLAQASNAIIIGFQVIADDYARSIAESEGVEIRLYRVIYQISDDIKKALEGLLEPRIEEKPLGRAEVRQIFRISKLGVIAGCIVSNGVINRSAKLRVVRDSVVIRDSSPIDSLRRIKEDVSEVRSGLECGIKLESFDDVKIGDMFEAYELVKVSRTLDSTE